MASGADGRPRRAGRDQEGEVVMPRMDYVRGLGKLTLEPGEEGCFTGNAHADFDVEWLMVMGPSQGKYEVTQVSAGGVSVPVVRQVFDLASLSDDVSQGMDKRELRFRVRKGEVVEVRLRNAAGPPIAFGGGGRFVVALMGAVEEED